MAGMTHDCGIWATGCGVLAGLMAPYLQGLILIRFDFLLGIYMYIQVMRLIRHVEFRRSAR